MEDIDCQVKYWNSVGPAKSFRHPVNIRRLSRYVGHDECILDYGCGYGRVLGMLRQHGYSNLIGVDASAAMIDEALRRHRGIRFERCVNPPHVDAATGSVAAVLLFTVLTCVPTDEGQRAILREAARVLRPGGLLYISDLWLQTDERNIERYERAYPKYGKYGVFDLAEGVTMRHHDPQWIEVLTAAFERIALDNLEVVTMNGHRANGFQWFGVRRP